MQNIFTHVYMLIVFGALLILHLQNLQPEENFSCDSVTEAFWYLLICQNSLCDEFNDKLYKVYVYLIIFLIFHHKILSILNQLQL